MLRMWRPRWGRRGHRPFAWSLVTTGLAFMLHATSAVAAPGDLDPSFSRDGKVKVDIGADFLGDGAALDLKQLADGTSMVVAADTYPSQNVQVVIVRVREDGSPDTSFSGDGMQVVDPPGEQSWSGASIHPDGSVAVVGGQPRRPGDFAVARIRADGELDPSFSRDGVQQIDFGSGSDDGATAVVTQPDGKLVVGGFARADEQQDFALARLEPNGDLDDGFSADGTATVAVERGFLNDLALSESGDVVAVGSAGGPYCEDLAVARLHPDGSPDLTFGGGGVASLDFGHCGPAGGESGQAVAIQSDGRIVVGGLSSFGLSLGPGANRHSPLLVRLEPDGDVDPSFPVLTEQLPVPDVADVAVQPTGILAIGASVQYSEFADFVLLGRQMDGAPDRSFPRSDGSVATNFDTQADEAKALTVQGDGRVLVAGSVGTESEAGFGEVVGVARYLMDAGRRDQDADGIRDKRDRCPRGFSKRRRGCPKLKDDGRVSLTVFDNGSFRWGVLTSNYLECLDRRRVLILKPRPGKDRVIRSTRAEYDQEFDQTEFDANLKPGRYYARVPRSVEAVGICPPLRSSVVRIRG